MYWRGIIVGLALGVWVASLALWALWQDAESTPAQCTSCCGGCGQNDHAHPPPVNVAWAPPGPARYYCGLSDHGGGFMWDHGGGALWDHGGGYLWDHGGGSLWDHGGGFVWDHGGGYLWDHGGGFVWDHGGGFVWDSDLSDAGPLPGSPAVPVPATAELGRDRNPFEFRCETSAGGINDVSVILNDVAVSIVMPDGNEDWICVVSSENGAEIEARNSLVNPVPANASDERAYCMVAENPATVWTAKEFVDESWSAPVP